MATIPGTNVAAMVVPFDDQDIFATHNDKYGRGGFRVCNTLAERDAIPSLRRKAGMWVKVTETGKVYELGALETNASWTDITSTDSPLIFTRTNEDFVPFPIATPVFAYSSTGVRRAVANGTPNAWKVVGLAASPVTHPGTGYFQAEGRISATIGEWNYLTDEEGGLVAGRTYFLHPSIVGKITQIAPTEDGQYLCRIGVANSPTELYIDLGLCIKL